MLDYDHVVYVQCASFLFNAESLSSLHKLSMSLLDTEEDLPVSGHEDQGVDGDVGGDVDDVLGGPVNGHNHCKNDPSISQSVFTITEKAPTRAPTPG